MTIKLEAGTLTTIASTELNSLANGAAALGAEFDNSAAGALFLTAGFELAVTYGSNPTAGNTVDLYLIPAYDGTNYGRYTTGAGGKAPAPMYVGSFPLDATTSAQRITIGGGLTRIELLPCKYKPLIVNNAGVAMPASGSTLKILPARLQ